MIQNKNQKRKGWLTMTDYILDFTIKVKEKYSSNTPPTKKQIEDTRLSLQMAMQGLFSESGADLIGKVEVDLNYGYLAEYEYEEEN